MPAVRYVGPFDEVDLPTLNLNVKKGGVVTVDEVTHANLCEQHDWQDASVAPAKVVEVVKTTENENGESA
jgi:hypothetical protein